MAGRLEFMRNLFLSLVVFIGIAQAAWPDVPVESPRDRVLFPEELKPARIKEKLDVDQAKKKMKKLLEELDKAIDRRRPLRQ